MTSLLPVVGELVVAPVGESVGVPGEGAAVRSPNGIPTGDLLGDEAGGVVVPLDGWGVTCTIVLVGPAVGAPVPPGVVSPVGEAVSSPIPPGVVPLDGAGVPW